MTVFPYWHLADIPTAVPNHHKAYCQRQRGHGGAGLSVTESKAKVDEIVDGALNAGAVEAKPTMDQGFMFGRSFHSRRRWRLRILVGRAAGVKVEGQVELREGGMHTVRYFSPWSESFG
jgi:hypothetical protein